MPQKFHEPNTTPDMEVKIVLTMIALVIVPATIALRSVVEPGTLTITSPNPSPLGYTLSLLIFIFPVAALAWWLSRHPEYPVERKAFWVTIFLFSMAGFFLDTLLGNTFFEFKNPLATMQINFPGYDFQRGWVRDIPIEEFLFYFFGGLYMLLVYIWGDLFWFRAYRADDFMEDAQRVPKLISLHPLSAGIGIGLILLAFLYKNFVPHPYQGGFPLYFTVLVLGLFVPTFLFFPTVKPFINWRAFSFGLFSLLLVSLLWEATLGVPYRWWSYRGEQMMGLFIGAWANLPVEAVFLWLVASWSTITMYDVLRIYFHMNRPVRDAFLGKKKITQGIPKQKNP